MYYNIGQNTDTCMYLQNTHHIPTAIPTCSSTGQYPPCTAGGKLIGLSVIYRLSSVVSTKIARGSTGINTEGGGTLGFLKFAKYYINGYI